VEIDMERRDFLKATAVLAGASLLPLQPGQATQSSLSEPGWRIFDIAISVVIPTGTSVTRAWLPLPLVYEPNWIRPMGHLREDNANDMRILRELKIGTEILCTEWAGAAPSTPDVVSRVATRDRSTDFSLPGKAKPPDRIAAKRYTQPTPLLPTDGIVLATARDVYGIRVTASRMGFKCLGQSGDVSTARELLFGGWETNSLEYNFDHDVILPRSNGPQLPFLMCPQAEVHGQRLDYLDPATFKYPIASRELAT
jgi:TAT (twin-arginine translocation) pathway signal sequence